MNKDYIIAHTIINHTINKIPDEHIAELIDAVLCDALGYDYDDTSGYGKRVLGFYRERNHNKSLNADPKID